MGEFKYLGSIIQKEQIVHKRGEEERPGTVEQVEMRDRDDV